jgi:hypothetical protein
LKRAHFHD